MFSALSHAIELLGRNGDNDLDTWIVCLTDGESGEASYERLQDQLQNSPDNLHIILGEYFTAF